MAKIIVDSPDQEANVSQNLAQWERRAVKAHVALITRRKLKRLGLILRKNEEGKSETNCSHEDKKIRQGGDEISVTKIPLVSKLPFENHQMIVRTASPLLSSKGDA